MSSCLSVGLSHPQDHISLPERLFIALVGPHEKSRRTVASAIKNVDNADVFEFDSYPPHRGYLRKLMNNPFNVLILELDSDVDVAMDIIEEASECPGVAILAYSEFADSKVPLDDSRTGATIYPIRNGAIELSQDIDKLAERLSLRTQEPQSPFVKKSRRNKPGSSAAAHHTSRQSQLTIVSPAAAECADTFTERISAIATETADPEPLNPPSVEQLEPGLVYVSSTMDAFQFEGAKPRLAANASAADDQSFWPKTLGDSGNDSPSGALEDSEVPFRVASAQDWSRTVISGDRCRVRELDPAETRKSDDALREMFRRIAEKEQEANKPASKRRIFASAGVASILFLVMSLVAWSHPQPLMTIGQAVLNSPTLKSMPMLRR